MNTNSLPACWLTELLNYSKVAGVKVSKPGGLTFALHGNCLSLVFLD